MTDKIVKGRFFVEKCDPFSSHMDHDILGWFDELGEAKRLADEKAEAGASYNTYCVFEPRPDADIFELSRNCVYEVRPKT